MSLISYHDRGRRNGMVARLIVPSPAKAPAVVRRFGRPKPAPLRRRAESVASTGGTNGPAPVSSVRQDRASQHAARLAERRAERARRLAARHRAENNPVVRAIERGQATRSAAAQRVLDRFVGPTQRELLERTGHLYDRSVTNVIDKFRPKIAALQQARAAGDLNAPSVATDALEAVGAGGGAGAFADEPLGTEAEDKTMTWVYLGAAVFIGFLLLRKL